MECLAFIQFNLMQKLNIRIKSSPVILSDFLFYNFGSQESGSPRPSRGLCLSAE